MQRSMREGDVCSIPIALTKIWVECYLYYWDISLKSGPIWGPVGSHFSVPQVLPRSRTGTLLDSPEYRPFWLHKCAVDIFAVIKSFKIGVGSKAFSVAMSLNTLCIHLYMIKDSTSGDTH